MDYLKRDAGIDVTSASGKRMSSAGSSKKRRTMDSSPSSVTLSGGKRRILQEHESSAEEKTSSDEENSKRIKIPPHSITDSSGRRGQKLRVKSIRRNEVHGDLEVIMSGTDNDSDRQILSVNEVKTKFPQELIEFLLGRIQFRGSYRSDSP